MLKMAICLIEKGHEVHLIANKIPSFHEQFKTFHLCVDTEQVLDAMRNFVKAGDVDIFHAHNEPSWYVTALKEMTDKPVILDIHDSYLARTTPEETAQNNDAGHLSFRVLTEERNNFQLADALVYPGGDFRKTVCKEFNLTQPSLTLPSYVPRRFYQYQTAPWLGGLVYEGKVNLPAETKGTAQGFQYCDYTALSAATNALGIDFHIYAGRNQEPFMKHYNGGQTFVHESMPFANMVHKISAHDWGLVGNIHPSKEWAVAMPNKLFEYMAAGLPVVAINADACAWFIQEHGIGIVISSLDELPEYWALHRECRANVIKVRQRFSMNAQIPKLEDFYKEVMGK
jgi:hypothetical protein